MQAIGLKLKRWQCVIVDMVIANIVGGITIFNSDFNRLYSEFLSLLIVWLSPWLAIYVVDWLLRRGKLRRGCALARAAGRYWRNNGFNIPGVVAQLAGMVASCLWIDSTAFVDPLESYLGFRLQLLHGTSSRRTRLLVARTAGSSGGDGPGHEP